MAKKSISADDAVKNTLDFVQQDEILSDAEDSEDDLDEIYGDADTSSVEDEEQDEEKESYQLLKASGSHKPNRKVLIPNCEVNSITSSLDISNCDPLLLGEEEVTYFSVWRDTHDHVNEQNLWNSPTRCLQLLVISEFTMSSKRKQSS